MWTFFFLKSLLNFLTILLLFYVFGFFFSGPETCGILAPQPGIEPTPPALEGEVFGTTREVPKTLFSSEAAFSGTGVGLQHVNWGGCNSTDKTHDVMKLEASQSRNPVSRSLLFLRYVVVSLKPGDQIHAGLRPVLRSAQDGKRGADRKRLTWRWGPLRVCSCLAAFLLVGVPSAGWGQGQ